MQIQPETLAHSTYTVENVGDFGQLGMEQDAKACELNQRGLHAAPLKAGVLMPEEYLVERFHNWIRAGLVL